MADYRHDAKAGDASAAVDFFMPAVGCKDDPKRSDTYVQLDVDIPGLKKNFTGKGASNADIKFDLQERSLVLSVTLRAGKGLPKHFRYSIKRLIEPVLTDPKKSYYRTRKDTVDIFLAKASPARWDPRIASGGIDLDP